MIQPGQNGRGDNGPASLDRSRYRCIFIQRQVCTRFIVIRGVHGKNLPQVSLAEDQHSVQALSLHAAYQTFRMAILPR
jgi:hypothetical protein